MDQDHQQTNFLNKTNKKMFDFLNKYVVTSLEEVGKNKHSFIKVDNSEILEIDNIFKIPYELKIFYNKIGYGFFHNQSSSFDRLLAPSQIKQINLKEDFYEFDPDLESYLERYNGEKILFFEVNEGIYLAMDKLDNDGKNPVYFFDKKIANSLEEFLISFDNNPELLNNWSTLG